MGQVAERALALLTHRLTGDPEADYLWIALVEGLCSQLEDAGLIAYGSEDGSILPGRALTDPAVAPLKFLPHAAMYTGGTMPPRLMGESDEDYTARARAEVVYPRGIRRGTAAAIRIALQPHLTGEKAIAITDDFGGPYDILVRTRTAETPDEDAARLAVEGSFVSSGPIGAIRAELRLTYIVSDEPVINELSGTINSYSGDTIDTIGT